MSHNQFCFYVHECHENGWPAAVALEGPFPSRGGVVVHHDGFALTRGGGSDVRVRWNDTGEVSTVNLHTLREPYGAEERAR